MFLSWQYKKKRECIAEALFLWLVDREVNNKILLLVESINKKIQVFCVNTLV